MSESGFVHVRRCHICGRVSERGGEPVERCTHCGKHMAPYYFFDEQCVRVYSDVDPRPSEDTLRRRPEGSADTHRPVRGFTVIW